MALPLSTSQYYPTEDELRDIYLRAIKTGFDRRGLTANTQNGSEYWYRAKALARLCAIAIANNKLARKAVNPLEAEGKDLTDLAGVYGVVRRDSAPAAGRLTIIVTGAGSVVIPKDFQATAPGGEKYITTAVNTVGNGDTVEVRAKNGGETTNQTSGTTVTWDSGSIASLSRNATVDASGLTGGVDADADAVLRARLIDHLSFAATGGNWASVKLWAENASASIAAAFVYQAARGPASFDVAIMKATGDRTLSTTVINAAAAAIIGQMPGQQSLNATTVAAEQLDVVIKASLPLPVFAGGAGGGWLDGTPWPNATSGDVQATAYVAATGLLTTDATAYNGLVAGSNIAIWDPTTETMYEYIVATATIPAGFVAITVVGGFTADHTDAYISAGAELITTYASTTLAAFLALGPGEKSADVTIVPRALRKPSPDVAWPTECGSLILAAISNAQPEVLSLDYSARYETGTTTTRTGPSVTATTADAPNILTLKHLAFRQA